VGAAVQVVAVLERELQGVVAERELAAVPERGLQVVAAVPERELQVAVAVPAAKT
jgi:hypothetical protein